MPMKPMRARQSPALAAAAVLALHWDAGAALELRASRAEVAAFGRVEFRIAGVPECADPFDPEAVDLRLELTAPDGGRVVVPAFFAQDYVRGADGAGAPDGWVYPTGTGVWMARFAPVLAGHHRAVAVLGRAGGELRSASVGFDCAASSARGFVRVARKDPRFLEFDNGEPFFAIGQNLAFIGEQQHVTAAKAREVLPKLAANGANYLRVWTCAGDWALAIEARKSAWERSWDGKGRLVADPADPARRCLPLPPGTTREVNPTHPVFLRPATRYVVAGRVRTEPAAVVHLDAHGTSRPLQSAPAQAWTAFRHEFTTGTRDWRLQAMRLRRAGGGMAWLGELSLQEAGGGPELLWEADMNRPARGCYNPLDCFLLDELVATAEQHGIRLQLCMLARDLYMHELADPASPAYDRAIAAAKRFFRHAIARWGASTSVAAWEYWNEMDPGLPTGRFHAELGEFLARHDPYRHLRTTSTWAPSPRDCRHPDLDLAGTHFYLRPADRPRLANEVEAVLDRARWLREQAPAKPALLDEFGLADDQWRITGEMRRSADLSDVHNALWASALSGTSGTALAWWWERLDQHDGHALYRPLSRFLAGVPWNGGGIRRLTAMCRGPALTVVGVRAGGDAWLWVFDPAAAWAKVVLDKQPPPERRNVVLELPGWPAGEARIEWHDTRTGSVTPARATADGGLLRLAAPPFRRDIACRLSM